MSATLRGLHLHVDGASGLAGDMTLGALLDLGVPAQVVGEALDAVGAGAWRLRVRRVDKRGIAATDVTVDTSPLAAADGDGHAHHPYRELRARIVQAPLGASTRARALDIFDRLADAESTLHGTSRDDVEFHEVGAIDAIVDVVGTAAALAWLEPRAVTCAQIAVGHGTLTSAHGRLPVPAPATVELLRRCGGVMVDGGLARELCTPTGAAILASSVTAWTPAPAGIPVAVGWGAGDLDLDDRPNVARVMAIAPPSPRAAGVWRLETNLDDLNPELCSSALDAVFTAGAVDAWWTPITMKKGRPALLLAALATDEVRDAVAAAMLRETTSLGVRFDRVERVALAREHVTVTTRFGPLAVKLARDGAVIRNVAPEHEACRAAAARHGVPLKEVYAAAIAAADAWCYGGRT